MGAALCSQELRAEWAAKVFFAHTPLCPVLAENVWFKSYWKIIVKAYSSWYHILSPIDSSWLNLAWHGLAWPVVHSVLAQMRFYIPHKFLYLLSGYALWSQRDIGDILKLVSS